MIRFIVISLCVIVILTTGWPFNAWLALVLGACGGRRRLARNARGALFGPGAAGLR
jgi:hypothetical protein